MATIDPLMIGIVIIAFFAVSMTLLLKYFKMPSVVAYIIGGVAMGSYGFNLIPNSNFVTQLGSLGVLFLLFFIGMEFDLKKIISNWKITVFGVFFKVLFTLIFFIVLSYFFLGWPFGRLIFISFVLSISSTAVVLKILQERNELDTLVGSNVVSVSLVQDIATIPMIVILSFFSSEGVEASKLFLQIIGGMLFIATLIFLIKKKNFSIPFGKHFKDDNDVQFFVALLFCFSFGIISLLFELSATLGAFLAGLIISAGKETSTFKSNLHPFYILFMALFFISIGLLIDLLFMYENFKVIIFLVLFVFLINTLIYAVIFRLFKRRWKTSFYAGALLSNIGEFSFVLAAIGLEGGIIFNYGYQMTIAVISLSLLLSPLWIYLIKYVIDFDNLKLSVLKIPKISRIRKSKIKN